MSETMDVEAFHGHYDVHIDDRIRLFAALAGHVDPDTRLYPGSYVDISASVFFDDVTYVDVR